MIKFDEFDFNGHHFIIEVAILCDDLFFYVKENDHYVLKISANYFNIRDNMSAMKSRIETASVNFKKELESIIIGFLTIPTIN